MSHLLDNDDDDEILDLTAAFFQSFIIRKRERERGSMFYVLNMNKKMVKLFLFQF